VTQKSIAVPYLDELLMNASQAFLDQFGGQVRTIGKSFAAFDKKFDAIHQEVVPSASASFRFSSHNDVFRLALNPKKRRQMVRNRAPSMRLKRERSWSKKERPRRIRIKSLRNQRIPSLQMLMTRRKTKRRTLRNLKANPIPRPARLALRMWTMVRTRRPQ